MLTSSSTNAQSNAANAQAGPEGYKSSPGATYKKSCFEKHRNEVKEELNIRRQELKNAVMEINRLTEKGSQFMDKGVAKLSELHVIRQKKSTAIQELKVSLEETNVEIETVRAQNEINKQEQAMNLDSQYQKKQDTEEKINGLEEALVEYDRLLESA